jgi:hypothetical protein
MDYHFKHNYTDCILLHIHCTQSSDHRLSLNYRTSGTNLLSIMKVYFHKTNRMLSAADEQKPQICYNEHSRYNIR